MTTCEARRRTGRGAAGRELRARAPDPRCSAAGGRGTGPPARRPLRRRPGRHRGACSRSARRGRGGDPRRSWPTIRWSRACCCCTTCTRWTSTRGSSARSTGSGPTSARTPAAWSTWASTTAWPGCGWRAAATAARRRPSPCELAIQRRVEDAAPEVTEVVGRGHDRGARARPCCRSAAAPRTARARPGRTAAPGAGDPAGGSQGGGWITLPDIGPPSSRPVSASAAGTSVLVCSVRGTLYAYLDACAACGSSMADGRLDREELHLPGLRPPLQRPARRPGRRRPGRAPRPAAAAGRQPAASGSRCPRPPVMTARS